jgi:hypothetical protein
VAKGDIYVCGECEHESPATGLAETNGVCTKCGSMNTVNVTEYLRLKAAEPTHHEVQALFHVVARDQEEAEQYIQDKVLADVPGLHEKVETCELIPKLKCEDCGTEEDVLSDPCPYAEEIHNDDTSVDLCPECREQRAQDI